MLTALDPDAPVLHPELGDNKMYERTAYKGDVDVGFAAATHIVEGTFDFGRHTGVTRATGNDFVMGPITKSLNSSLWRTGCPHDTGVVLKHLGIPERDIRVIAQDCGGSYGIKSHFYGDEFATAVLSIMLCRPVRYRADRIESFASDIHARQHRLVGRMGIDGGKNCFRIR